MFKIKGTGYSVTGQSSTHDTDNRLDCVLSYVPFALLSHYINRPKSTIFPTTSTDTTSLESRADLLREVSSKKAFTSPFKTSTIHFETAIASGHLITSILRPEWNPFSLVDHYFRCPEKSEMRSTGVLSKGATFSFSLG